MDKIKVMHIITGLSTGGAEMMLYKLLASNDERKLDNEVISLTAMGPVGNKIQSLGVPVNTLNIGFGFSAPLGLFRLVKLIKRHRPDVIQTWMPHANLIGGWAARMAGAIPVVWGIRSSKLHQSAFKRSTVCVWRVGAAHSRWLPSRTVYCSETAVNEHVEQGYSKTGNIVIPNGFDLDAFKPDNDARASVRDELGVDREALLIGLVGHFDAYKDIPNFVRAASILCTAHRQAQFVLCGKDLAQTNNELAGWIDGAGLREQFHLLDRREDMPRVMGALDILCSASRSGEGFPNVVGEAMACGVPCVVTDVGDSAMIVGDTGVAVPSQNPEALATGLEQLIGLGRQGRVELGKSARNRVTEHFNLPDITRRYSELYLSIAQSKL